MLLAWLSKSQTGPFSHAEYDFLASLKLKNKTQWDGWDLQVLTATYVWVYKGLQIPIQFAGSLWDALAPEFDVRCLQISSFGASSCMGGSSPIMLLSMLHHTGDKQYGQVWNIFLQKVNKPKTCQSSFLFTDIFTCSRVNKISDGMHTATPFHHTTRNF